MEEKILFGLICIVIGYFIGYNNEKKKNDKEKAALKRTLKCFYKRKSNNEVTESIIHDAIALGINLNYIEDSFDLYQKWNYWRNYGVSFANDRFPDWEGPYNSNGKVKEFKLSNHTIYIPEDFTPTNVNLDKFKHFKSHDLYRNLL
jgi:hypothetical protein